MNILLVDDHDLFREGLKYLLQVLDDSITFLEASSIEGAAAAVGDREIDLILLDYYLPGVVGLSALEFFRQGYESARLVVLTGEEDPRVVRAAIDKGAAGYIPKTSSREVLVGALKNVLAGNIYLPPSALKSMTGGDGNLSESTADGETVYEQLSPRQLEVLMKAIQGKANKVIARELDISDHTVKAHLSVAFRTLGVQNRTEAVFVAARLGINPSAMPANVP